MPYFYSQNIDIFLLRDFWTYVLFVNISLLRNQRLQKMKQFTKMSLLYFCNALWTGIRGYLVVKLSNFFISQLSSLKTINRIQLFKLTVKIFVLWWGKKMTRLPIWGLKKLFHCFFMIVWKKVYARTRVWHNYYPPQINHG